MIEHSSSSPLRHCLDQVMTTSFHHADPGRPQQCLKHRILTRLERIIKVLRQLKISDTMPT